MKKSYTIGILMAFVSILFLGTAALAYDCPLLNSLSPEKQKEAEKIYTESDARLMPIREKLIAKRLELDALYRSANANPQEVSKLSTEISNLHTQARAEMNDRAQRLHKATGLNVGSGMGRAYGNSGGAGRGNGRGMGGGYGGGVDCPWGYEGGMGRGMGGGNGRGMGSGMGGGYGRGMGGGPRNGDCYR